MEGLQIVAWAFCFLLVAGGIWMMVTNKKDKPLTGGGCAIKSIYVYISILISLIVLSFLRLI